MKSCCNPFNLDQHKSQRKGLKAVPLAYSEFFEKNYGHVVNHVQKPHLLCSSCRLTLYKIKNAAEELGDTAPSAPPLEDEDDMPIENPVPGGHDEEAGPSSAAFNSPLRKKFRACDLDEEPEEVQREALFENLDTALGSLGISPLPRNRPVTQKISSDKLGRLKKGFVTKLSKLMKSAPNSQDPDCVLCDEFESNLVSAYNKASTRSEKYRILTLLPASFSRKRALELFGCSQWMLKKSRQLQSENGPFSAPPPKAGKPLSVLLKDAIIKFYLNDSNSRVSPSARDTIIIYDKDHGLKERVAKRNMLLTLSEMYTDFKLLYTDNPLFKVSLSTFAKLKPRQCIWAKTRGFHVTCTCIIHENFKLLLSACHEKRNLNEIFADLVCDVKKEECMLGVCRDCPKTDAVEKIFQNIEDEEDIEFYQWVKTDSTEILKRTEELGEFKKKVKLSIPVVLEHHYVTKQQKSFLEAKKLNLAEDEILVQVDFAENYSFVVQDAVQGFHWNNKQCTVHPFVVFYKTNTGVKNRSYVIISECNEHSATSFKMYLDKVVPKMKADRGTGLPNFKKIIYVSDGAGSQYKNQKNFANLANHFADYGIAAEWHFTPTAHGKSTCDAISAVVKGTTRRASLKPGNVITDAAAMFAFLTKDPRENHEYIFLSQQEFEMNKPAVEKRYDMYTRVKGTRKYHSFIPLSTTSMAVRRYSSSPDFSTVHIGIGQAQPAPVLDVFVGCYVAVAIGNTWQIGVIAEKRNGEEEEEYLVRVMRKGGKTSFSWGDPIKETWVSGVDIVCQTHPPSTTTGRLYTLPAGEVEMISALYFQNHRDG